jgi:hypothetical protein
MALKRSDVGIRMQREAGVAVPDQGILVQGRGAALQVVH